MVGLVQMVEPSTVTRNVTGSNPVPYPILFLILYWEETFMIYSLLTLSEKNKKLSLISTDPGTVTATYNNFIGAVKRSDCSNSFNITIRTYTEGGSAYSTSVVDLRTEDNTDLETLYVATIKLFCEADGCSIVGVTETLDSKTIHLTYNVSKKAY